MTELLEYKPSKETERFLEGNKMLYDTLVKIKKAWDMAGFEGDPVFELTSALTHSYVATLVQHGIVQYPEQ